MRNSNPNVVYRGNIDNGRLIAIKRFNKLTSPDNHQFFGEARVALYLAQALDYCSSKGRALYYDLNAYRVLFDQKGMQHKDFPRGCES